MKTTEAANGKWSRILPQFGIDESFLNGKHHKCPCTGEGDDRFRFSDHGGTGAFFCACSEGEKGGFGLLECKTGRTFSDLAHEVDGLLGNTPEPSAPKLETYADRLRKIAKPAPRSAYLESRGLEMPPGLLWAREVDYWNDGEKIGTYAAMLGPVVRNGVWQTFHATYLDKGKKADVPCPRKVLTGGSITGGAIELYPAAEIMGVSEGIETGIAAKILFDCPVHAAISAGGMAKWDAPAVAKEVHIFADHDANFTGHRAAWTLANRLAMKGITAIVHMPAEVGDWNDYLLKKRQPEPSQTGVISPTPPQ